MPIRKKRKKKDKKISVPHRHANNLYRVVHESPIQTTQRKDKL